MPAIAHAVIAAAGMATRLGLGRSKCLVEFGGVPLIVHTLRLLRGVDDVRIVCGFGELEIMEIVRAERPDVLFVRNPAYRTTTTLGSYHLGARYLSGSCLFMDADILFRPTSLEAFLARCTSENTPLIGVTDSKTVDAVYADVNASGQVTGFSREIAGVYEWANVAWLPTSWILNRPIAVFEQLSEHLPIETKVLECYEIDTPDDLARAQAAFHAGLER